MGARPKRHDPVAQLRPLLAGLTPGAALDVGFGDGESLELLAELGYGPLYGYEISEELVGLARERLQGSGVEPHLFAEDATRMAGVPDASIHLAVIHNALQFFDVAALAGTLSRVLRPGGRLVGHVARPGYYLQPRHLATVKFGEVPWWLVSYPRSALRSAVFAATGRQPLLGASAPEIGWTRRTVRRFASLAGMEVVDMRALDSGRLSLSLRRI